MPTNNTTKMPSNPSSDVDYTSPWGSFIKTALYGLAGDYMRDNLTRSAYNEAYQKYLQRIKDLGTQTFTQGGQVTLGSLYNAAGDIGHNVPQAYERALTRVRATPEAMLAYSQGLGAAGQLLGTADAAAASNRAAALSQNAGLRRQAAQASRNTGSASTLRDIVSATAGQSANAMQQMADAASRGIGANIAQAGQLMQQSAAIPQQSQMAQYQLFARPREAQLHQALGSYFLNRPVPYDAPQAKWGGITGMLQALAGNYLSRFILRDPTQSIYEASHAGPHTIVSD